MTPKEQAKGCNLIECYKGREGYNKTYLIFKQPKQVGEIEAVEFAEWILDNTAGVIGTKQRNYYVKGLLHGKYTTKQLYEMFKNQK